MIFFILALVCRFESKEFMWFWSFYTCVICIFMLCFILFALFTSFMTFCRFFSHAMSQFALITWAEDERKKWHSCKSFFLKPDYQDVVPISAIDGAIHVVVVGREGARTLYALNRFSPIFSGFYDV